MIIMELLLSALEIIASFLISFIFNLIWVFFLVLCVHVGVRLSVLLLIL